MKVDNWSPIATEFVVVLGMLSRSNRVIFYKVRLSSNNPEI